MSVQMKKLFKKEGDVIINEGEESTDAYIILKGQVDVIKNNEIIATLQENSLFGEIGLVDQRPRTATCVAKTICTLGTVTTEHFAVLLEHRPKAVLPILRLVAERMRSLIHFVDGFIEQQHIIDTKAKYGS
jgi:CRP/FNR family transcriptional regulator, cyclic AMP receptor protein